MKIATQSRRTFLKLTGASALYLGIPKIAFTQQNTFPAGFLWGAASASAQVESRKGRGKSNWDVFVDEKGHIRDGSTNAINTEFESRYSEDFQLLSQAGLNAFRFSFEWSRIQPDGPGEPNAEGLATYDRIIDEMLERGMEPLGTMCHWAMPVWVGDFRDRDLAWRLADYADILTRKFGDRVGKWLALNEPNSVAAAGYGLGIHAPGLASTAAVGAAVHHQNIAQGLMISAARANLPSAARVSTTINLVMVRASSDKPVDIKVAEFADAFWNTAWLDPLFGRGYPELVRHLVDPFVKNGDMEIITVKPDFIGMNNYCSLYVHAAEQSPLGFLPDLQYIPPGAIPTELYLVEPNEFKEMLIRVHKNYGEPDIYVTETGFAVEDPQPVDGVVDDPKRSEYIKLYLQAAQEAVKQGVKLKGIFYWSATDNWEWAEGSAKTFGLIQVDRETLKRTPKKSLSYYSQCIKINGVA
ncbi:glycoside hydrolase family 1 protein [Paenochrobactrum sp. BZR 588]|uniref:glycoside hydrolase family 1 protein n=1 Tax=Paenochrobactrum TaxID=999488 RepID=UPI0035BBE4AE